MSDSIPKRYFELTEYSDGSVRQTNGNGFAEWLARERAKAKAEALREAAGVLDVPGAVNYGDGGVFVRVDFRDPNKDVPLVQWLRDRADELEGKQ